MTRCDGQGVERRNRSGSRAPPRRGARAPLPGRGGLIHRADRGPARPLARDNQGVLLRPDRREGPGGQGPLRRGVPRLRRSTQARNGKGDAYAYCNCAARRSVVSPAQPGGTRRCSWVQWLTRIRKVKGTIACQESDGHAQVSGVRRRGTRVIWRKLDCLKPNLQKMKSRIRRKDTCYRRHALRWHSCRAIATFGAWSVAQ